MKQDKSRMPMIMQQQKPVSRVAVGSWVALALLLGLWAATQFFAWQLQYQPALGSPAIEC